MTNGTPRTLILATSHASELRRPELRPAEYPRTEYVELSRLINCDILDYSIYDRSRRWGHYRSLERKLRLDFHLALVGFRRARECDVVLLMSEQVAIPYMLIHRHILNLPKGLGLSGGRGRMLPATVYVSAHASRKQAKLVRSLRLFADLDIAVGNTRAQQQFFERDMLIPSDRIRCVLYAADERFYVPAPPSGPSGCVFSTGIANRDYPTLFEAAGGLSVPVKVALGGRSYSLAVRRALPPLPDNVELAPPTDSAGMRRAYQEAALVVVPLKEDRGDATGCSVVLEAGCCARPVVTCDTAGMRDYIEHGRTGVLTPIGDPAALRDALESVISDPGFAESLGSAARAEREGRLSFANLVDGLAGAVMDAAGRGSRRDLDETDSGVEAA